MRCTKTGCHVYLEEYDEWVYGDAFLTELGQLVLNLVSRDREPSRPVKHYTVTRIDHWFNEDGGTSMKHPTVLVSRPSCFVDHGYNGVPI